MIRILASLALLLIPLVTSAQFKRVAGNRLQYKDASGTFTVPNLVDVTSITNGTASQVVLGNKSLGTLGPALVGLPNVPNVDATQRSSHQGTQPVSTVVGAVSAVNGIPPVNGSVTLPTASATVPGLMTAAQAVRLGKSAQGALFTLNGAGFGLPLAHNLGTTNLIFLYYPPGAKVPDGNVGYDVFDANTVTLTVPYNGASRETVSGTVKIIAIY